MRLGWIGFAATCAIAGTLIFNIVREPQRQEDALDSYRQTALESAQVLYTLHCLSCHGSAGQGLEDYPDLSADYIRQKDTTMLFNTISRGRYQTEMAAFSIEEGGVLTRTEIEDLVILIQYGDWQAVQRYVIAQDAVPEVERLAMATEEITPVEVTSTPVVEIVPTATDAVGPINTPTETLLPVVPTTTATPTQPTSVTVGAMPTVVARVENDDIPVLEVMPTAQIAFADPVSLPVLEVVPTQAMLDTVGLPSIDVVPTSDLMQPASIAIDGLPQIAVVPTVQSDLLDDVLFADGQRLYNVYCADCHGEDGNGRGRIVGVRRSGIPRMDFETLADLIFGNFDIDGHEAYFSPDEQTAIIYYLQYWDVK